MVMDNIIINKCWQEDELIELHVVAKSKYVTVNQNCYISVENIIINSELLDKYVHSYNEEIYIEFGKKEGNYTPAFSLKLFPMNSNGHLTIEVDLEIDDNNSRCHRCIFFIDAELGAIERFAKKLSRIQDLSNDDYICIYEE